MLKLVEMRVLLNELLDLSMLFIGRVFRCSVSGTVKSLAVLLLKPQIMVFVLFRADFLTVNEVRLVLMVRLLCLL